MLSSTTHWLPRLVTASAVLVAVAAPVKAGRQDVPGWAHEVLIDRARGIAEGPMSVQNRRDFKQQIGCSTKIDGSGYCWAANATDTLVCGFAANSPFASGARRLSSMSRLRFVAENGTCKEFQLNTGSAENFPEAGYHLPPYEAVVDRGARTAKGGLGAARNSADTKQYVSCELSSLKGHANAAYCMVQNAAGYAVSCTSIATQGIASVRGMGPHSYLNLTSDTYGRCSELTVSNSSLMEGPR